MIYGITKSIRVHPNAWIMGLGIMAVILPLLWFVTATIAFKAIHTRHWDETIISYSREEALSLSMYDAIRTKPFAYVLFGSWVIGPGAICVALALMIRRHRSRRKLNQV
jgi:hypothetical protein